MRSGIFVVLGFAWAHAGLSGLIAGGLAATLMLVSRKQLPADIALIVAGVAGVLYLVADQWGQSLVISGLVGVVLAATTVAMVKTRPEEKQPIPYGALALGVAAFIVSINAIFGLQSFTVGVLLVVLSTLAVRATDNPVEESNQY